MRLRLVIGFMILASSLGLAQAALDGPNHPLSDPLLDELAGSWKLTGRIAGQAAEHTVRAEWVLNHQFLSIHETAVAPSKDGTTYEALIFVGFDNASERYVVHWIDIYGGRFSETLGYGRREGDAIRLTFEYPDGPFHTSFLWDKVARSWRWEMDSKSSTGAWKEFGRMALVRTSSPETK